MHLRIENFPLAFFHKGGKVATFPNCWGKYTKHYFSQIFQLFPKELRPENRKTFKPYDGLNNLFNLAYSVLKWKVYRATIRAKLEPYLGFLHSEAWGNRR